MKTTLAILSLLTLSACCNCMTGGPKMAHSMKQPVAESRNCTSATVSGMTCEACATTVSENLKKLPGVEDVAVSVSTGVVKIYTDGNKGLEEATVKHIIERSGYGFTAMKAGCQ